MRVTTMSYGQFLVNSPVNFTGTYFADTVDARKESTIRWKIEEYGVFIGVKCESLI